jgi:hypothetical protein
MIVKMNLNGAPRKQLAKALSLITGEKPIYTKVPECKYLVGDVTILKDGSIECPDDSEVVKELRGYGFTPAEPELVEKPNILEFPTPDCKEDSEEELSIVINVLNDLTEDQENNLRSIVNSKRTLLQHAFGIENVDIEITPDAIRFPWYIKGAEVESNTACMKLATAIVEMAKRQKRASSKEQATDNEKYAFRCFLLRLGFIGDGYKEERKILMRNLKGNSAWK